jgi:hypothetical protein
MQTLSMYLLTTEAKLAGLFMEARQGKFEIFCKSQTKYLLYTPQNQTIG